MKLSWALSLSILTVLAQTSHTLARAISSEQTFQRRSNGGSPGPLTVGSPETETDATVAGACTAALANITTIGNAAGFAGCYNILKWDATTSQFQADLRIFKWSESRGDFAGVSDNMVLVMLDYPSSTTFKSLSKTQPVQRRQDQNNTAHIQQFSLQGGFKIPLDLRKLNESSTASLMVPKIALQTTVDGQTVTSDMLPMDMVFFTTGEFTDLATSSAEVTNPNTAVAAIDMARGFVLPGTTFGIFPTGLIVTSIWMILFVLAYGIGTIARLHHRNLYRKRAVAMASLMSLGLQGVGGIKT